MSTRVGYHPLQRCNLVASMRQEGEKYQHRERLLCVISSVIQSGTSGNQPDGYRSAMSLFSISKTQNHNGGRNYIAQVPLPVPISRICWSKGHDELYPSIFYRETGQLTLGDSHMGARWSGHFWLYSSRRKTRWLNFNSELLNHRASLEYVGNAYPISKASNCFSSEGLLDRD